MSISVLLRNMAIGAVIWIGGGPSSLADSKDPCSVFSLLDSVRSAAPGSKASRLERASYEETLWRAWKSTAEGIFSGYMSGDLHLHELESCLPSKDDQRMLSLVLPQAFFDGSLLLLRQGQSRSIRAFVRMIEEKAAENNFVLLKLKGHFKEATPPTASLGGVKRGSGSIFMSFDQIDPREWLAVFIHEFAHSLDRRIPDAIAEFHRPSEVAWLARELGGVVVQPEDLSPAARSRLDRWLMAGLDRGFLAEYRAWSVTFKLYEDGLREGMWEAIPWMERVLARRRPKQSLKALVYDALDPSFSDPGYSAGLFSLLVVKTELWRIRALLRGSPAQLPSLYNLEGVFGNE
jgi:hypothetical protein